MCLDAGLAEERIREEAQPPARRNARVELAHGPGGSVPRVDVFLLPRFSRALTEQIPRLGQIKVLRQWAGCYDVTPDNNPVLGRTPGLPNMLQMSGFVGHGFMMAPAVAERMAAWMVNDTRDELFTRFDLDRFRTGKLERETMIIG